MDAASNDFIINVTSTDDINCTLDKTFDQIQEAVQAGKKVYTKLNGIFTIYMPMVLYSPFVIVFAATAFISESIEQYVLAVPKDNSNGNNPQFIKKLAVTYDSDSTMKQVYMNEDPVNDMQIATKKYVDDSLDYGADLEMSDTSTHPVRNMVIKKYVDDALDGKAGTDVVTESANGLMSKEDKTKLDGIAAAAKGTFYVTVTQGNDNSVTADKTSAEVYAAYEEGYAVYALVKFRDYDDLFILSLAFAQSDSEDGVLLGFAATGSTGSNSRPQCMSVLFALGLWIAWRSTLAWKEDIPTIPMALKNPNALTIEIGNATVTYDGSTAQTVTIDDGGNITVDAKLNAASENPVQNKAVKAALDGKLDKTGGTLTGNLKVTGALFSGDGLSFGTGENIHFTKAADDAGKLAHGAAGVDDTVPLARLKVASPTEDDDAATKAYVDGRAAGTGAVRYDAAQALTGAQKLQARKNVDAAGVVMPQFQGFLTLTPANGTLGAGVGLSPTRDGNNFALDISDVNEGTPTKLTGVKTPTDADTNAAATVEYVKAAVPTALKNPNALTIKIGSTTVTYDGSAAKTVEIADGSEVSY